jgi:hypothetical protein
MNLAYVHRVVPHQMPPTSWANADHSLSSSQKMKGKSNEEDLATRAIEDLACMRAIEYMVAL